MTTENCLLDQRAGPKDTGNSSQAAAAGSVARRRMPTHNSLLPGNEQVSATDKPPTSPPKPKRLSISLSADAAGLLESLSEEQGISQNEVIRKALATEAYIQQEIQLGSRILIQKADDEIREVVFR